MSDVIGSSADIVSIIAAVVGVFLTLIAALLSAAYSFFKQLDALRKEFEMQTQKECSDVELKIERMLKSDMELLSIKLISLKEGLKDLENRHNNLVVQYNRTVQNTSKSFALTKENLKDLRANCTHLKQVTKQHEDILFDVRNKLQLNRRRRASIVEPNDNEKPNNTRG